MSYQSEKEKNKAEGSAFFVRALIPLPQDQELAQFFTDKTKEWEDKEERPLRAPRMPPKDRGKAVFQSYRETHSILGSTVGASLRKLTEVHRMDPRGTGSFSS